MPSMFRAAQLIGRAVRKVRAIDGDAGQQASLNFDVSFLFSGQKSGGKLRLFNIYATGNFIECTIDTPYLQIGEHKYGKPILDRAATFGTELYDALKIGLISMDSTMRANLAVGLPTLRLRGAMCRRPRPRRASTPAIPIFAIFESNGRRR